MVTKIEGITMIESILMKASENQGYKNMPFGSDIKSIKR